MEKSLDERISENIKKEIKSCGKKQNEIAAEIGIKPPTLSQYCSGKSQPSLANFSRLCSAIGASADEILEVKKDK